jgi:hypothetical protein
MSSHEPNAAAAGGGLRRVLRGVLPDLAPWRSSGDSVSC